MSGQWFVFILAMDQGSQVWGAGEQALHRFAGKFVSQSRPASLEGLVELGPVVRQEHADATFTELAVDVQFDLATWCGTLDNPGPVP